jgi:hypothetical protein
MRYLNSMLKNKVQHPHISKEDHNVHVVRIYDNNGNEVDRPFVELKNHRKILSSMVQDHAIQVDFCIIGAKGIFAY